MSFIFALFFPAFAALVVVWFVKALSTMAYAVGDMLTVREVKYDVTE
jgi:hypothetical protein